jgi:hypothetical protein
MAAQENPRLLPPPGIVAALTAGFDTIANNLAVIIWPMLLDVFLWLGPRLRLEALFRPTIARALELARQSNFAEQEIKQAAAIWEQFLQINLIGNMRTFPIGVASLIAPASSIETPFGHAASTEITSAFALAGCFVLLTLIGWLLGSIYYYQVATAVSKRTPARMAVSLPRTILQSVLLNITWWVLAIMACVPLLLFFVLLTFISASLAQFFTLIVGLLFIWLLLPIYFSAHGIFIYGQNAFSSIMQSLRLVRFTMPTLGLFALTMLVISAGLSYLWRVPAPNSWLLLVGITAHAFISTAMLAASFIYYRDLNAWLQIMLEKIRTQTTSARA